jgi:hypothetical protein
MEDRWLTPMPYRGSPLLVPPFEDSLKLWNELQIRVVTESFSEADEVLSAFRQIYSNGDVKFATCSIAPHELFDWHASRNRFYEMGFFRGFWQCPAMQQVQIN